MAINLLEMMSNSVGQQLIGQAGSFLGASESSMKSAVGAALPALLAGIMQKGATPSGASSLMGLLDTPGLDSNIVNNLGSYLGGGTKTSDLLSMGSSLLSNLFGDKLGGLVSAVGSASGMKTTSASNLLALAAPLALASLKGVASQNKLDAGGLMKLLGEQGDFLKTALDSRITSALGFASPAALLSSLSGAAGRAMDAVGRGLDAGGRAMGTAGAMAGAAASTAGAAAATSGLTMRRWLPWILLVLALILIYPLLRSLTQPATKPVGDAVTGSAGSIARTIKSIDLPGGGKLEVADGGFMSSLVVFLNSPDAAVGKGFSFDELQFDTASATIKPESNRQLDQLVAVLKAYPNVAISVEGHTDNTGDAASNKKLSMDRAAAIEKALESKGIDDARISSAGIGQERPIASNDTEDGRARNRRVEVVILKR